MSEIDCIQLLFGTLHITLRSQLHIWKENRCSSFISTLRLATGLAGGQCMLMISNWLRLCEVLMVPTSSKYCVCRLRNRRLWSSQVWRKKRQKSSRRRLKQVGCQSVPDFFGSKVMQKVFLESTCHHKERSVLNVFNRHTSITIERDILAFAFSCFFLIKSAITDLLWMMHCAFISPLHYFTMYHWWPNLLQALGTSGQQPCLHSVG